MLHLIYMHAHAPLNYFLRKRNRCFWNRACEVLSGSLNPTKVLGSEIYTVRTSWSSRYAEIEVKVLLVPSTQIIFSVIIFYNPSFFSYLVINGHLNTTKKTWRNFEKIFLPGVKSVEARHVLVLKKERGFVTQNNAPLLKWATKKSQYFEFHISTTLSIIKINFAL